MTSADNKTAIETRSRTKMKTAADIYVQQNSNNEHFFFERKIQIATDGLQQHYTTILISKMPSLWLISLLI
ncbi:MAG TPA: hypothetical protein VFS97_05205 [Nitrososphaeraceae archaeon]|nr:hypothetical protein [Nitrososphaeraceae archaeon]